MSGLGRFGGLTHCSVIRSESPFLGRVVAATPAIDPLLEHLADQAFGPGAQIPQLRPAALAIVVTGADQLTEIRRVVAG